MAEAKQKYVSNIKTIKDSLIKFYRADNQSLDVAGLQKLISQDAEAATAYREDADFKGLTNEEYAYIMNYEGILKVVPDALPLAPLSERKTRDKNASQTKATKPDPMASVPTDAKTEWALEQLRAQAPQMIEVANKESILKIIKMHRPLFERFIDSKNPVITVSLANKYDKLGKLQADEANLVQDEENEKNYRALVDLCSEANDSQIAVNRGKESNAWGAVQIKHADNTPEIMTKTGLTEYLSQGHIGINLSADTKKPGAKIKWVAPRNKKNSDGPVQSKPVVTITNMKAVREKPADYYVYARDVDTTKTVEKTAQSALSYKVYALNEQGKRIISETTGAEITRTKRITGKIEVYEEKPSKNYWSKSFESSSNKGGSGSSSNASLQKTIDAQLLANAIYFTELDNAGAIDLTSDGQVNTAVQDRLKSLNFAAFNGGGESLD